MKKIVERMWIIDGRIRMIVEKVATKVEEFRGIYYITLVGTRRTHRAVYEVHGDEQVRLHKVREDIFPLLQSVFYP